MEQLSRVGRWMGRDEYGKMLTTGKVQESFSGATYVATPASPAAYERQAKPGSIYVEFDVPASSVKQLQEGWGRIIGPSTLESRLAARRGTKAVEEMPPATNIQVVTQKEPMSGSDGATSPNERFE